VFNARQARPVAGPTFVALVVGASVLASPLGADAGGLPVLSPPNCTEMTYGMPCDTGENACAGVCQPDFSQPNAPMACLPVDSVVLARLNLASLDGIDCAPKGIAGSDCTHVCSGGQCVATNAASGAACMPANPDSDASGLPVSVCSGACDGQGVCQALAQGCDKYGRGELGACLYTACDPSANTPGCKQFPSPEGQSCSTDDPCIIDQACTAHGGCAGGQSVDGCVEADDDAGHGKALAPDEGGAQTSDASSSSTDESFDAPRAGSSGCSIAPSGGGDGAWAQAALLGLSLLRRTRRAGRLHGSAAGVTKHV
jgi:hypothetical protein